MTVAIHMLWASFSVLCMPTSSDAYLTRKFQDGERIPEVVITLRRKTISRWSQRSAAAAMFQGTLDPPPPALTLSDFRQQCQVPTGSTVETVPKTGNTSKWVTETDIDTILVAIQNKTLLQQLRSPWYCFQSQSYNYFRYTSAIFWVNEASVYVGIIRQWKTFPPNISIATEIASISVSVTRLLVLPVWGTISISGLYLMLFSEVGRCRYQWKWIKHAGKLCVAAGITLTSLSVTDL